MQERLRDLRDFVQARNCKQYRHDVVHALRKDFKKKKFNINRQLVELLRYMCNEEKPTVFKDEKIGFLRTTANSPYFIHSKSISREYGIPKTYFWDFGNVCLNWEKLLNEGLLFQKEKAQEYMKSTKNKKQLSFYASVIESIDLVLDFASRYEEEALSVGNLEVANSFSNVPKYPAKTLQEALQALRFVHSIFYMIGHAHMGLGRLDQYLYPFYKKDLDAGKISKEEARDLITEYFISLNKDSDLYRGVQQGDNGQSVMLGGCKKDGTSGVNELTYMILEVSRDLKLIDPKINLRVDSNTPDDLLRLGCELTQCGLGFPQYSNDEVVIPALVKKGYSLEDAREYTVAACWEFIIPGKGADIVNVGAVSFPYAVDRAFEKAMKIPFLFSMKKLRKYLKDNIYKQTKAQAKKRLRLAPSPLASVLYDDVLEKGIDATISAKYRNVGVHGAGSANAADALAAIRYIYEKRGIDGLKHLLKAKKTNFAYDSHLREEILNFIPKVGNADAFVDNELKFLFDCFADSAEVLSTNTKKIRPGSGSAMYYIWLTDERHKKNDLVVDATVDGKLKGEPLSSSLSPSHNVKVNGVLSVLKSYSNIDYSRIMNGGPITIELTPSVFTSENGLDKLASLIKYFVSLGNQQLQLNVLDLATLEDALIHPELHRNLIVRVWGWSGYFCELAPEYQQHIINRHKYVL